MCNMHGKTPFLLLGFCLEFYLVFYCELCIYGKLEYERYWLTKTKKKGYEILNRDIFHVTSRKRDLVMYMFGKDTKERAFILGI